jgi:histidinol-phosphatase
MLLASGQLDAIVEVDLDADDVMPSISIVEAAVGVVTDWDGRRSLKGGNVLACGDCALHSAMLEFIERKGEDWMAGR